MIMLPNKIDKSEFYIACATNFDREGNTTNIVTYIPFVKGPISTRTQKILELIWKKFVAQNHSNDFFHRRFGNCDITMIGYNDCELYSIACAIVNTGATFQKKFAVRYDDEEKKYDLSGCLQAIECRASLVELEDQSLITRQPQFLSKRDVARIILQLSATYPTLSEFLGAYKPSKTASQR